MLKKIFFIGIIAGLIIGQCYGKDVAFKEVSKVQYGKECLHSYCHKKTGLEVEWIENDSACKGFALGVKTPTEDSTGVNHIIEHTILTGSKKYPSAKLFFDASGMYPHTYMNALTSGDMTIYPFATPYKGCYDALLDIYLSSIFEPTFLEQPYGFYEEAFNYDVAHNLCAGVVYNEMKGAGKQFERIMYRKIRTFVYDQTPYSYDSGGEPNEIPKLTYEQFLDTYQKYYYPGNMKIILYGDLPIDTTLSKIASYLSGEAKASVDLMVMPKQLEKEKTYAVLEEDAYALVKSYLIKAPLSVEDKLQLEWWINCQLGDEASAFQKGLEEEKLYDVHFLVDEDLPYPIYSIVVKGLQRDELESVNTKIDALLKLAKEEQINESRAQSNLQKMIWQDLAKDESQDRWLMMSESILDGWAHERSENQYYLEQEALSKLKGQGAELPSSVKQSIEAYTIWLTPGEEVVLDPMSLSPISQDQWQEIMPHLKVWQQTKCDFKPINIEELVISPDLAFHEKGCADYKQMSCNVPSAFARSNLYLSTQHISQEELPYLFLYSYLLEASSAELTPFEGVLETSCLARENEEGYEPLFRCSLVTQSNMTDHGQLFAKMREYLLQKSDSWYEKQLNQLINARQDASRTQTLDTLGSLCQGAEKGNKRYLYEQGFPFYTWCKKAKMMQNKAWISEVKAMDEKLYHTQGMTLAITKPKKWQNPYASSWVPYIKAWPETLGEAQNYNFKTYSKVSFLDLASDVDYIYMQYTCPEERLSGKTYLAATYLSKAYLTPEIRARLGAYGAGCAAQYPHTLTLYTYRDPNYKESLKVIKEIPQFLQTSPIDEKMLTASKIEALAKVHKQYQLINNAFQLANKLEWEHLKDIKSSDIERLQREILVTSTQELQGEYTVFEEVIAQGTWAIATKPLQKMSELLEIYKYR